MKKHLLLSDTHSLKFSINNSMQKAMLFKIYFFGLCAFDTESQEEKRREESNLGCSVTTCVHAL